jgi:hypothetical protein
MKLNGEKGKLMFAAQFPSTSEVDRNGRREKDGPEVNYFVPPLERFTVCGYMRLGKA